MRNEVRQDRPADARFYLCPTTVKSGDPVLIGGILPAVAMDNYQSNSLGTVFRIAGSFDLTVIGQSDHASPPTGAAIKPGDQLYATGTLDATTNMITGLTIDKGSGVSGAQKFGTLDQTTSVASGATATATVKLRETAA